MFSSGCYVGLILPADITPERRKALEETLLQIVGLTTFPTAETQPITPPETVETPPKPSPRRLSSKIAEGLIQGVCVCLLVRAYRCLQEGFILSKSDLRFVLCLTICTFSLCRSHYSG